MEKRKEIEWDIEKRKEKETHIGERYAHRERRKRRT
jgi:hypothetical protein